MTAIIIAAIVVLAGAGYAVYRARKGDDDGTPDEPGAAPRRPRTARPDGVT